MARTMKRFGVPAELYFAQSKASKGTIITVLTFLLSAYKDKITLFIEKLDLKNNT